jgi:hypothetical protein
MSYQTGQKVFIRTGTIVSQTDYPQLGLTYYCIKVFDAWSNQFNLIYVEKKQLDKIMNMSSDKESDTHLGSYSKN